MKADSLYKSIFSLQKWFAFVIVILFTAHVQAQDSPLTVISNQNGSPSELKLSELRSIFMGERQRWRSGTKISIALMKTNTSAGIQTSRKVYDMSSDELNKFWLALVFQGKAQAPNFFSSATELENFVANNPGAIGIVDIPVINNITKTVLIEGRKSL